LVSVTDMTDGMTAVVFDFYGTLTPVAPTGVWTEHVSLMAGALGVAPEALTRALDESHPERFTGALGGTRQTFLTLAARLGVHPTEDQLDETVRLREAMQENLLRLRPETVPVIGQLRARGLRIGLVSDCTAELPEAWPRLPVAPLVDAPVFSFVEGTRKPDPRLFRAAADRLGVAPAACLYVGDGGGRELTGSAAVGMHPVLLAGPDWYGNRMFDREDGWRGPRISSLTELLRPGTIR
jgi:putative hydrolase of the HAD superfamily